MFEMKLSIITVNLNNAEGLRKTIESVVSQTFTDFEYIVIDGGSTDGSIEIIKQYTDKITYWVSEPDKGIYNAMNKGILRAKGEYCLFLNSGDYLYSDTVLSDVFSYDLKEDIIIGRLLLSSDNTTELGGGRTYACLQKGQALTLYNIYWGSINHQSSFIKRNLFHQYGLYDENYKIISDWIFFLKTIGMNGIQVKFIDMIIVYFDVTGIGSVNISLREEERKNALEKIVPKQILTDYKYFQSLEEKYLKIKREYDYLFKFPFTYFAARAINKLIRLFRT